MALKVGRLITLWHTRTFGEESFLISLYSLKQPTHLRRNSIKSIFWFFKRGLSEIHEKHNFNFFFQTSPFMDFLKGTLSRMFFDKFLNSSYQDIQKKQQFMTIIVVSDLFYIFLIQENVPIIKTKVYQQVKKHYFNPENKSNLQKISLNSNLRLAITRKVFQLFSWNFDLTLYWASHLKETNKKKFLD